MDARTAGLPRVAQAIENEIHLGRDVTSGEETSQIGDAHDTA